MELEEEEEEEEEGRVPSDAVEGPGVDESEDLRSWEVDSILVKISNEKGE